LYLGRSTTALQNLKDVGIFGEAIDCDKMRNPLFFTGIVISFIAIPTRLYFLELKNSSLRSALEVFMKYNKEILVELLRIEFKNSNANFNIRIFKTKRWFRKSWKSICEKQKMYEILNISPLGEKDNSENLSFIVSPKDESQGLVGLTYQSKNIMYDFDIQNNTINNDYRLDENQLSKTSRTRFVLTAPIFDEDSKVIAIISIDSETLLKEPKSMSNVKNIISNFCQKLHSEITVITSVGK